LSYFVGGYEIVDGFVTQAQIELVTSETQSKEIAFAGGGIRNAEKKYSSIHNLAWSNDLLARANNYLNKPSKLVRAILFNKTEKNNWLVGWHQDKTVAVSREFDAEGWGPWSIKDDVVHVQPPIVVLNQMITFRIHLDDSSQANGCLKVLPKSHELGILDQNDIQEYVQHNRSVICEARSGSALVMRPHILHASSKAKNPSQRRVLHLEYSSFKLPSGISWA
jgi:Phytanoyl-CoA dioxygenase (PhyH)